MQAQDQVDQSGQEARALPGYRFITLVPSFEQDRLWGTMAWLHLENQEAIKLKPPQERRDRLLQINKEIKAYKDANGWKGQRR